MGKLSGYGCASWHTGERKIVEQRHHDTMAFVSMVIHMSTKWLQNYRVWYATFVKNKNPESSFFHRSHTHTHTTAAPLWKSLVVQAW